jgi:hypothetical protein
MRQFKKCHFILLAVMTMALLTPLGNAQQTAMSNQAGSNNGSSALKLKGEVGAYGELYSISGQEERRPGSTGRLYLRSTLSIWNSLSVDFNFLLSTENSSARQAFNKFGINPRWGWGEANLGSFTESYSPLTLNGIEIRGGGIRLRNGILRLGMITGLTKREVSGNGNNKSYRRLMSGGFIGIGKSGSTSFQLIALSARDRLSDILDSSYISDTTGTDTIPSSQSVTPQENLVVSALTNISFSKRRVVLKSEISGCAITRDRRAAELESSDIPQFAKDIFTPRVSSSADFASMNELNLNLGKTSFKTGFNYIGPGYVSLGVASLLADKQEIFFGMSQRLKRGTVRLDLSHQNDNLINQKSFTTDRNRLSTMLNIRPMASWGFNFGITYQTIKNDAADTIRAVDYHNLVVTNNHTISFRRNIGLRNIIFDYILQSSNDKNTLRKTAAVDAHTFSIRTPFGIKENLDMTPQLGIGSSRVAKGNWKNTYSMSLLTQYLMLQGKLVSSYQIGYNKAASSKTFQNSIRGTYRLDEKSSINLELSQNSFRGSGDEKDFDEFSGQLTISRRF